MSKKVLLCDDEVHILRAAEIKVARAGYDVRICARRAGGVGGGTSRSARRAGDRRANAARRWLRVSRRIRSHEETKDFPILMLTAKGFELRTRR